MEPKGQNELTKESIKWFKNCLKSIQAKGYDDAHCPISCKKTHYTCRICHQAFPKNYAMCPCHSEYTKTYLIRRVKEIIKTGKI